MSKAATWCKVVGVGLALAPVVARAQEASLLGFSAAAADRQRQLEARFDAELAAAEIGGWIERLSARPHPVGSPYGRDNAEFMAGLLRSWGFEVAIEEFQVLFPTPTTRRVELLSPTPFTAALAEPPLAEDATSSQTGEQLPPYNAYSIDGDVTGELVYVNFGVPEDYEELEKRGIDVAGKVVIARYGGSWRGIKPKVAAEHGAVGCLIYSDPHEDGYFLGDSYPAGGWRPESGAQRGSVADMPLFPGDPLTPGVGATAQAERLQRDEAPTLTRIPVLPLSWQDARPLLAALGGPVAPEAWRGSLPLTYHLGPGPAKVRLAVAFDWRLETAYDVIARLEGSVHPDQWIVRGNHHDAWVNGATDPSSGMAAALAEAEAIGALARSGWRPKRTVIYAAWDAEEPGLLGSTEWVEHHAAELASKALVYINSDSNSRGFLEAGGSHGLETLVNQVARDVTDPQTGASVAERWRAGLELYGTEEEQERAKAAGDLPLYPLGSGSDYTPFLQHLGVASLNVDFGGEGHYGQYHSIYDSFAHYQRFMDPGFRYGVALAQVGGRLVLRLAEAEVPPFAFQPLAATVGTYVEELEELAKDEREETATENRRIADGVYARGWDPEDHWVVPQTEPEVPYLNLAPLHNAATRLTAAAERYDEALAARAEGLASLAPATADELARRLAAVEHALTRSEGLPGRPWYVHHVYAPGLYTGYGVKTLPGVREAIELEKWSEVEAQVVAAARALEAAAATIDGAAELLE